MRNRRVLVTGIAASIVMGMIEMIYEALAGDGFWSPMIYIGATALRSLQTVQIPVAFNFWGVVFGLMGHMMNSVILGLIFVAIFSRSPRPRGALATSGAIYALVIFVAMWYAVLPAVDPVMLNLNPTVFAIAHVMWGAVLGLLVPQGSEALARLQSA